MRRLAVVLVACPLAGCMMGPNYHRPPLETPATYRFAAAEARDTANTGWWTQFGDPVLDGLVDEALGHNLSVKIAAANVEQAAAVLKQVRSPLYPQAAYGTNASGTRRNEETGPIYGYEAFAGASWEIDLWGRVRRLSESARAQVLATEQARLGVILSLVSGVADTYIQLRALDEQLEIATRTRQVYAESVRLFELQFKHGVQPQMTVEQARTQYETAAAAVPQLESQIAQAENALSVLLGRNPGPIARGQSIRALAMPAVPAGLPSQILERRPDIRQAEQQLVAANAQIGAAKALYFPAISLTGALGVASLDLKKLFSGPSGTWSYQGSIAGPIFAGGTIKGQVRQAEAARNAAELGYRAAVQSAFADVDDALVARAKLVEQLGAEGRLVAAAKEYSRLARMQFDGGVAPYFTVLQAEQQLFPAELNEVQLRASLFAAIVNVYKTMGGGWVVDAGQRTR
jgi:outer membrane protein, multidrug efflux system